MLADKNHDWSSGHAIGVGSLGDGLKNEFVFSSEHLLVFWLTLDIEGKIQRVSYSSKLY